MNNGSEKVSVQEKRMNMPESELWDSYFFFFRISIPNQY